MKLNQLTNEQLLTTIFTEIIQDTKKVVVQQKREGILFYLIRTPIYRPLHSGHPIYFGDIDTWCDPHTQASDPPLEKGCVFQELLRTIHRTDLHPAYFLKLEIYPSLLENTREVCLSTGSGNSRKPDDRFDFSVNFDPLPVYRQTSRVFCSKFGFEDFPSIVFHTDIILDTPLPQFTGRILFSKHQLVNPVALAPRSCPVWRRRPDLSALNQMGYGAAIQVL
eukprot:sb/3469777/